MRTPPFLLLFGLTACFDQPTGTDSGQTDTGPQACSENGCGPTDSAETEGVQTLTLHRDQVMGTLTDFPLLVSIDDPENEIFALAHRHGDNLLFQDADGQVLDHELEHYDPAAGVLVAWVRLPTLRDEHDTVLTLHYVDTPAAPQATHAVWDAHFVGVWHLDEAPNNDAEGYLDSNAYQNHATPSNFSAAVSSTDGSGRIAGGLRLRSEDDTRLTVPNNHSLDVEQVTMEAWVMPEVSPHQGRVLEHAREANGHSAIYGLLISPSGTEVTSEFYNFNGNVAPLSSGDTLALGQWNHVVATYDGSQAVLYVNGHPVDSSSGHADTPLIEALTGLGLGIGNQLERSRGLEGSLDEVRLSNVARSPEWIATQYNNQSSPESFYSLR